ncbi:MAG: hypothetical protein HC886_13325 [Leptolyngbyaceae cyanobacterium SM1_1_3]|nr:hypothetical protein [Leptolyngbyaceae cyanobacterium SM1_1_3]NJN01650.1 hypothetical protein [Leptolyngbyaceae cyanobacterium RM1_1_2]NJO10571.1 hypothetical protein [Leptolyngbyaceae cyanobacterium SL_1_1]
MNSPLYSDPSFQSAVQPEKPHPASQTPSVPISVYRELAAELQATKAVIDTLRTRNEQLVRQNQQLQQEVHQFVQATLQLGQFAGVAPSPLGLSEVFSGVVSKSTPAPLQEQRSQPVQPPESPQSALLKAQPKAAPKASSKPSQPASKERPIKSPLPAALQPFKQRSSEKLYTEQPARPPATGNLESSPRELSGLWLAISIIFIVTTAFGAGFLIMKPLLNQR